MTIILKDLKFGELNDLKRNPSVPKGDRRRTTTATAIRFATEKAFEVNTLAKMTKFTGFVVGSRRIDRAIPEYKGSIMAQVNTPVTTDSNEEETDAAIEVINCLYKVYIPELEPLPAPKDYNDPVIGLYADVSVAKGLVVPEGDVSLNGALVEVTYQDVKTLSGPKITRIIPSAGYTLTGPMLTRRGFEAGPPPRITPRGKAGNEQEIPNIPNIKKSTTNEASDKYTHWGTDPAMVKLLTALNAGAEEVGTTLTINSALRTPYNQVRIMFQNYKRKTSNLTNRAAGRKYLVDLYNDKAANLIADAFEKGNYQTEQEAGTNAGYLSDKGAPGYPISNHLLGRSVDVAFQGMPIPSEKVSKSLLAATQLYPGIDVLIEKDHFHVTFRGESAPSKVRSAGGKAAPSQSQLTALAKVGLKLGTVG